MQKRVYRSLILLVLFILPSIYLSAEEENGINFSVKLHGQAVRIDYDIELEDQYYKDLVQKFLSVEITPVDTVSGYFHRAKENYFLISFNDDGRLQKTVLVTIKLKKQIIATYALHRSGEKSVVEKVKDLKITSLTLRKIMMDHNNSLLSLPEFSRSNDEESMPASKPINIDLHTHFGGEISAKYLTHLFVDKNIPYPCDLLLDMFKKSGDNITIDIAKVCADKKNITFSEIRMQKLKDHKQVNDLFIKTFAQHLEIPYNKRISFNNFERIYTYRKPFFSNPDLFTCLLFQMATEYKKNGISYAEISTSVPLTNDWPKMRMALERVRRLVPEVDLRVLGGFWRGNSSIKCDDQNLRPQSGLNNKSYFSNIPWGDPYVVGIDIFGEETNSIRDCEKLLLEINKQKEERHLNNFQIRIHAGESDKFQNNINDAVKMGATRIGHGMHFKDKEETLKLLKEKNVIVEINPTSNFSLRYVDSLRQTPIVDYLKQDIRITFGSDGSAIFLTNSRLEKEILEHSELGARWKEKINNSDYAYWEMMQKSFKIDHGHYNKCDQTLGNNTVIDDIVCGCGASNQNVPAAH